MRRVGRVEGVDGVGLSNSAALVEINCLRASDSGNVLGAASSCSSLSWGGVGGEMVGVVMPSSLADVPRDEGMMNVNNFVAGADVESISSEKRVKDSCRRETNVFVLPEKIGGKLGKRGRMRRRETNWPETGW